jgi:ubiquinone/menaquinone biosynthesis C-methylase UbiE
MLEQEFDRFAQEYEQLHASVLTASGEGPAFFAAYKPADMRRHLAAAGVSRGPLTLLDFGCGVGGSLPHLRREFPYAELIGADVSRKSLDIAERRYPGLARLIGLNETGAMPLPEASADVVFSACVFHHIPEAEHHRILCDLHRVTKPGGSLFIFEHNPLNPLTRRVVDACAFDENAVLIGATAHLLPPCAEMAAAARKRAHLVPARGAILRRGTPSCLREQGGERQARCLPQSTLRTRFSTARGFAPTAPRGGASRARYRPAARSRGGETRQARCASRAAPTARAPIQSHRPR